MDHQLHGKKDGINSNKFRMDHYASHELKKKKKME